MRPRSSWMPKEACCRVCHLDLHSRCHFLALKLELVTRGMACTVQVDKKILVFSQGCTSSYVRPEGRSARGCRYLQGDWCGLALALHAEPLELL